MRENNVFAQREQIDSLFCIAEQSFSTATQPDLGFK